MNLLHQKMISIAHQIVKTVHEDYENRPLTPHQIQERTLLERSMKDLVVLKMPVQPPLGFFIDDDKTETRA